MDTAVHVIEVVAIYAPDDGSVFVQGHVQVNCPSQNPGDLVGHIGLNMDRNDVLDPTFGGVLVTIRDCDDLLSGLVFPAQNLSPAKTYNVQAGEHVFCLLAQRDGLSSANNTMRVLDYTLTAIFVDQGANGLSAPIAAMPSAPPAGNGAMARSGR